MKINERGYWENPNEEGHGVDKGLAKELAKFFVDEALSDYDYYEDGIAVIDIGCGNGYYTRYLNNYNVLTDGYDGNPYTAEITNGMCQVADFSVEQRLGTYHWVLSLEVAEHIPAEFEDVFINNLDKHNTEGIVLSWSIPEYGGDGHVNPQPNSYVTQRITDLGYTLDVESTERLRRSCAPYPTPCYWFSKTLLVFRKNK